MKIGAFVFLGRRCRIPRDRRPAFWTGRVSGVASPWPCDTNTSTCRSFATISSGLCFFWGIPSSSIWLESLLQGGPLFRGQAIRGPRRDRPLSRILQQPPTPFVAWRENARSGLLQRAGARSGGGI